MRRALCTAVCFGAFLVAGCPAQDAPGAFAIPIKQLRALEKPILDLSAIGRAEEADALRSMLAELGYAEKALDSLDRRRSRVKEITRKPESRLPRIAKGLEKAIQSLAGQLPQLEDEAQRRQLADLLLRLDHELTAAREVLGQRRLDDRWLSPEELALAPRQTEIQVAVQSARQLQLDVTVGVSGHELIRELFGRDGHVIEVAGLRIHSPWPAAKTSRLARNLIRAMALSRHLIDGSPIVPPQGLRHETVLFTGRYKYRAAIEADLRAGRVDPEMAKIAAGYAAYYRKDGTEVVNGITENHALGGIFSDISGVIRDRIQGHRAQPSLIVGHANWVLMALTGAHLPGIAFFAEGELEQGTKQGDSSNRNQRLLRGAGMMGARSWLRYRVERGDDPAWSRSFEDQVGKIGGEDMLKSTFVVEYLQLRGPLAELLEASQLAVQQDKLANIAIMEKAIVQDIGNFEEAWRRWMRGASGPDDSLLARLRRSPETEGGPGRDVLQALQGMRFQVFAGSNLPMPPLDLDPALSAGAVAHARYLTLHPDQYARWPEAHEEFTDREGFSPEGCWAAAHSIIDAAGLSPVQTLDNWMGTFYHRLPLLHAGLMRIGWGQSGEMVVMDAGSVVAELGYAWRAAWPAPEMLNIPTGFVAELPNPFPGQDQSKWGYPITLQIGTDGTESTPEVSMSLREGLETGPLVPASFSSPQLPGNPQLVPDGAWCLIPKRPLKAATSYFVEAVITGEEDEETLRWWFRTR